MKTKNILYRIAVLLAAYGFTQHEAGGALSITNGDFESGIIDETDQANVFGWFDSNPATGAGYEYSTWQSSLDFKVSTDAESGFSGQAAAIFSDYAVGSSYLYQSIGSETGATSFDLTFTWGNPDDVDITRDMGLRLSVYELTGAFAPADETDVDGAAGVSQIGGYYDFTGSFPISTVTTETQAVSLSGYGGAPLYLRFVNFTSDTTQAVNESWVTLDNVSISNVVTDRGRTVPDGGTTLVLLGAILPGMAFLRRKLAA